MKNKTIMVWTDINQKFNDAFFMMLDDQKKKQAFPIWKNFTFRNHPIDQLHAAHKKIDEVIAEAPTFSKALFLKAIVQRNLNYNEESILYLHQAKENDMFLYACNIYLAEYYIYKLKFEEALNYLEEIIAIYPQNKRVNLLLTLVNMELFHFEEAKKYINILYQLSDNKFIINLLNQNLNITEGIVEKTPNKLLLKNFKLKSFNYNLQLKTNLINYFKKYIELGINYDTIGCFINGLILKNITVYPTFNSFNDYNVNTILNYLKIEENQVIMLIDSIDFENDFVKSYDEYREVEQLMKEDL
ncbi:tetratricopeptide repeat protein [Faecalibacter rhinopitheci]|uniref:Tetratricopeptide repeat protein n=1 Tax=Faecalibacter rhinopitheci TaxID=2779678 RepID=A0A8J7FSI1_9FLAO|nr:hypothetical protein [Faecalibacter rhinopitheci]MBF0598018.1 hypothetical protein [Faecalibacter rhinopitheci]